MARKKDKQSQKDKKTLKAQSAKGAPVATETAVAPSARSQPTKR